MQRKYLIKAILTGIIIFGVSAVLYMYTAGYRFSKEEETPLEVKVTGMISAKSIPEGASVYLDEELITATNSSIPGIKPGKHVLKITKRGFTDWEKEIEVFPEMVTDITAVLLSKTPRLEPLTQTGATNPSMSPSLSSIAYFSQDEKNPGVWVLPLTNNRLNIFSAATASVVLEDTSYTKFSEGQEITWSPNEKQLLVQLDETTYYLVDLASNTTRAAVNPDELKEEWQQTLVEKRELLLGKLDLEIEEDLQEIATNPDTLWSPDGNKFVYTREIEGDKIEYRVYNLENPLPVGETAENTFYVTNAQDSQPKISWYSDSFHLIMLENGNENDRGRISLIRIDGTNKTELYNNVIHSNNVFSAPAGDKIIILTSFKSEDQVDLYTVSIR
jgi:hypothetical protein